jgi:hypothetical protein
MMDIDNEIDALFADVPRVPTHRVDLDSGGSSSSSSDSDTKPTGRPKKAKKNNRIRKSPESSGGRSHSEAKLLACDLVTAFELTACFAGQGPPDPALAHTFKPFVASFMEKKNFIRRIT